MSAKRTPITTLEDLKQAIDSVVRYNWDDDEEEDDADDD